ncbi:unnamed protein product [Dicrocoelium dendriticum]|nr:unnamed protein product [Dicrocoelium dendriticum]
MTLESNRWSEPSAKARKMSSDEQTADSPTGTNLSCTNVKGSPRSAESVPSHHRTYDKSDYEFTSDDAGSECAATTCLPTSDQMVPGKKRPLDNVSPSNPTTKSPNVEDKRIRKFICRYCCKAFSLMNVLKVHERIHTGEKPYICEICDKAFNQSGSLNRHKNTHMKRSCNNRSYSCRFCPRQFLHSSQLQEHEATEHGAVRVSNSPHAEEQRNLTLYERKSLSASATEALPSCCSPAHTTASSATSSAHSLEDTGVTSKLTSSFNVFGKSDANILSFPPLPVGLNIFAPSNSQAASAVTSLTFKMDNTTGSPITAAPTSRPSDSLQCDLCPQTFSNRTELDKHCAQHLLQQMGFTFGTAPIDTHVPAPVPTIVHPMNQLLRTNPSPFPIEEILLNMIQHQARLTVPASPDPIGLPSPACTDKPQQVEALHSLTAALFPGAAAAATLTALSQLISPNASTNSVPLFNQPSLFPSALTIPSDTQTDPKFVHPHLLTQPSSAGATTNPLGQLLRAIAVTNSTTAPVTADLRSSSQGTLTDARLHVGSEQGLDLAVGNRTRVARQDQPPSATIQVPQPQTTKMPPCVSRLDVDSFPWLVSQDLLVKSLSFAGLNNLSPSIGPPASGFPVKVSSTQLINNSSPSPNPSTLIADSHSTKECSTQRRATATVGSPRGDHDLSEAAEMSTVDSLLPKESSTASETATPFNYTCCDNGFPYTVSTEARSSRYSGVRPHNRRCSDNTVPPHTFVDQSCKVAPGRHDLSSINKTPTRLEKVTNGPNHITAGETLDNSRNQEAIDPGDEGGRFAEPRDVYEFPSGEMRRESFDRAPQWFPSRPPIHLDPTRSERGEERSLGSKNTNPTLISTEHGDGNSAVQQLEPSFTQGNENTALLSLLRHFQSEKVLWACEACQIYFLDRGLWQLHVDCMHSNAGRFTCAACCEDQKDSRRFLSHFIQMHRPATAERGSSNKVGHSNSEASNCLDDLLHEEKGFRSYNYDDKSTEPEHIYALEIAASGNGRSADTSGWTANGSRNGRSERHNSGQRGINAEEFASSPDGRQVEPESAPRLRCISSKEEKSDSLKELSGVFTQS